MDDFFEEYFSTNDSKKATKIKLSILKKYITDNQIYKFIQFDENEELNNIKLETLINKKIWFSHYRKLNDPSEYEIVYKVKKISKEVSVSRDSVRFFVEGIKELYDLCSFSYEYKNYMWETYANYGNGICLVFEVVDYDYLFPIIYQEKKNVNFTKLIIETYKEHRSQSRGVLVNNKMSLLPWILKNPVNGVLDSTKEKEVRILYSPFDKSEFNEGKIYPKVKQEKKYNGINVFYSKVGLKLQKIIIGHNCSADIIKKIVEYSEREGILFSKMD